MIGHCVTLKSPKDLDSQPKPVKLHIVMVATSSLLDSGQHDRYGFLMSPATYSGERRGAESYSTLHAGRRGVAFGNSYALAAHMTVANLSHRVE